MTDGEKARLMADLIDAAMNPTTADGCAGLKAMLGQIETEEPGALRRVAERISLLRLKTASRLPH